MKDEINIRDEEILLLGLCRLEFGVELKVMLRALAEQQNDWEYFARLANSHGVAALIYDNLDRLGFLEYVPAGSRTFLRNAWLMSLQRNARNMRMVGEVVDILGKNHIRTVLLKGMALELMVYGNRGLRQMSDADILIPEKECLKAYELLQQNGFVALPVKSLLHKMILPYAGKHLPSLIREDFAIEIHRDLFGGKNSLTDMLLENSITAEIEGRRVFVPEPLLFFLYLVKHLYLHELHSESQLRLYADLVILIEKSGGSILNEELLVLAHQAGMSEILAWRLEPLRDLWGLTFPLWLNDFIDKWYDPASINRFVFFLRSPKGNASEYKGRFYRKVVQDIPGLHRRILFVLGDLFPTITFMKNRYKCSATKAIFYYPHRFGKLLWFIRR